MSRARVGFGAITAYAIAMALVEAACVVSLKALYFPEGWRPPFHELPRAATRVEQWREIATLVMISAVAFLGRPGIRTSAARALWTFGVWDLGYYVFLRLWTGFPERLTDWDVVFLVPRPWIAPVWLPVAVSGACLITAFLLRDRESRQFN